MKRSVLLLFMLVTALSGCKSNSSEVDERDQAALAPGIAYVKRFLEE